MPSITTHIYIATKVSSKLQAANIQSHAGNLLLGSTYPDIRSMIKVPRELTHFSSLDVSNVSKGTETMFEYHPNLHDLDDKNISFICGYISHLVADELWITEMYRPYFGTNVSIQEQIRDNLWDRAIQLDMDQKCRNALGNLDLIENMLHKSEQGINISFIDGGKLTQWREWVCKFIQEGAGWDRLRLHTSRMYKNTQYFEYAINLTNEFIELLPDSLNGPYSIVTHKQVSNFIEDAAEKSLQFSTRYLNVS